MACTIGGGLALGALAALSPLLVVTVPLTIGVVAMVTRDLPRDERRMLAWILGIGIATRIVIVMALAVMSIPTASDQSGGVLFGDESYLFERSLRTRDLLLGLPPTRLDYMMVFDTYANTKYVWWLSWIQVTFGPSPYSMRLFNGFLFVAAAAVMYRLARKTFGVRSALCGMAALLLLPSLMFWSVSILKDSVFFLATVGVFAGAIMAVRDRRLWNRAAGCSVALVSLWALSDLRPGALVLTAAGLAIGFALRWTLDNVRRAAATISVLMVALALLLMSKAATTRVRDALTLMAREHLGHATTPGHDYRTLDDVFYTGRRDSLVNLPLSRSEAIRYIVRSGVTFVLVPVPWNITVGELAIIPEQILWYLLVVLSIVGVRESYRRDPLLTSLLLGYMLAMAAALALVNGNVGTLVRLRGLVSRFAIWIGAVGLMVSFQRLGRFSSEAARQ